MIYLLQFKLSLSMDNKKIKESAKQIFSDYIESTGHRKTPERFAIVEEIYSLDGHFDVESLYLSMKSKNYRVSRATLYNTIDLLIDSKLIVKHQFGKNIAQYERAFNSETHDHMIDLEKGTITEFFDPRIRQIIEDACKKNNFDLSHHTLYIYGVKRKQQRTRTKKTESEN